MIRNRKVILEKPISKDSIEYKYYWDSEDNLAKSLEGLEYKDVEIYLK